MKELIKQQTTDSQKSDHPVIRPINVEIHHDKTLHSIENFREFKALTKPLMEELLNLMLMCQFHNRIMLYSLTNNVINLIEDYLKMVHRYKHHFE